MACRNVIQDDGGTKVTSQLSSQFRPIFEGYSIIYSSSRAYSNKALTDQKTNDGVPGSVDIDVDALRGYFLIKSRKQASTCIIYATKNIQKNVLVLLQNKDAVSSDDYLKINYLSQQ